MAGRKKLNNVAIQIRLRPEEHAFLKAACADMGIKPATYVRTVLLKDLAAAFPKDKNAKRLLVDQVAEIAGQVVRALSRADVVKKSG